MVERDVLLFIIGQSVAILSLLFVLVWRVSALSKQYDMMIGLMWADYCERKGINPRAGGTKRFAAAMGNGGYNGGNNG